MIYHVTWTILSKDQDNGTNNAVYDSLTDKVFVKTKRETALFESRSKIKAQILGGRYKILHQVPKEFNIEC